MKYVFIINLYAGERLAEEKLDEQLSLLTEKIDYEKHITSAPKEAIEFVKNYSADGEEVCFVACGGDGTLNEVVSGLVGAENKYFAVLPYGSGNDFVKYYEGYDFLSLEALVKGEKKKVDVLKVNDKYSVNMCNIGLEAVVGSHANKVKNKGGKHAYFKGLIKGIFTGRYNKLEVFADGEKISGKHTLLCSIANGKYAGSKYMCAPRSENDDGLTDICLFHSMSLIRFLFCVKHYVRGTHLELKSVAKKRQYRRVKEVEIRSDKETEMSLDGEILKSKHFLITVLHNALNFLLPKKFTNKELV